VPAEPGREVRPQRTQDVFKGTDAGTLLVELGGGLDVEVMLAGDHGRRTGPGCPDAEGPSVRSHRASPWSRSDRAASTMARIFRVAMPASLTGRFEKVANPQSGLRKSRSAG